MVHNEKEEKVEIDLDKAIFKFSGGNPVLLCSGCSAIIKTIDQFSDDEKLAMKDEKYLKASYCCKCSSTNIDVDINLVINEFGNNDSVYKIRYIKNTGCKSCAKTVAYELYKCDSEELLNLYKNGHNDLVIDLLRYGKEGRLIKTWNVH